MPDIIKLLPDSVANQIAAGEVIQRPASVVKELMENSVDAGSKSVKVIIKDSGKTLIQVIDDGTGMSETDARLSFERHATSKISSANDLFTINTKGFRGEALASIAAVSMVELKTRKKENESGTIIIINGSRVETQEPCSCAEGSSFSVKNLFYNIPARRKFLKSDNTEMRHIITEFQKIAIPHPGIRFSLYSNDNEIFNLIPGNFRQRIVALFGKQINNDLITVETETTLISISGFVGKPETARRTYGEQFFFVNNRFMKHPYFHKAVAEAYQNILPPEAIPSYFIMLTIDPAAIDINIHPTKTEIKFEDERSIWQILMASVKEALGRFNIVPSIDFDNEGLVEIPVSSSFSGIPQPPVIEIDSGYDPFAGDINNSGRKYQEVRFERERLSGWEKMYGSGTHSEQETPGFETERRFIQIRNRYILCPVKSGLMIIDQKRAHERILYERFLRDLLSNGSVSQSDLYPVDFEMNPADFLILKEIESEISRLGFTLRLTGNNKVTILGRPSDIGMADPVMMLEIVIEEYKISQSDPSLGLREKVAAAMAGASAINYGKTLLKNEMEELFDSLFACSAPNYSPKGRPVISILTSDEIDKRLR